MKEKTIYKSVHNYTKFKLIEMLIKRFQKNKTIEYDLDSIESLADDVINVLEGGYITLGNDDFLTFKRVK